MSCTPRSSSHCVLVFRDQNISRKPRSPSRKLWGEPVQQNPLLKGIDGFPEFIQVTKIPKETASTEAWHYDSPYTPVPPKISILAAVTGAARRRHHVVQPVPVVRAAVAGHEAHARRPARQVRRPAPRADDGRRPDSAADGHASARAHPSGDRPQSALRRPSGNSAADRGHDATRKAGPLLDFLYEHSTSPTTSTATCGRKATS